MILAVVVASWVSHISVPDALVHDWTWVSYVEFDQSSSCLPTVAKSQHALSLNIFLFESLQRAFLDSYQFPQSSVKPFFYALCGYKAMNVNGPLPVCGCSLHCISRAVENYHFMADKCVYERCRRSPQLVITANLLVMVLTGNRFAHQKSATCLVLCHRNRVSKRNLRYPLSPTVSDIVNNW
jgi:hypothetical protein